MDTPFADYTYYSGTYYGVSIPSSDFPRLAMRASERVETATFNRASEVITANTDANKISAIKKATCALADALYEVETKGANLGLIQSERVGDHSVTYVEGGGSSDEDEYEAILLGFLGITGLMYKGFA